MSLKCGRCGAGNPDSTSFCLSCGQPLTTTSGGAAGNPVARVHRLRLVVIFGLMAGLFVVTAAAGLLIGAAAQGLQLPDPEAISVVTGSPQPSSQPRAPGTTQICNPALCVSPPAGWKVVRTDSSAVVLVSPSRDGIVAFGSNRTDIPVAAQELMAQISDDTRKKRPDTDVCLRPQEGGLNGPKGFQFGLCYTYAPAGGQAFRAADLYWVATNAGGTAVYYFEVFTHLDKLKAFQEGANPVLTSVEWKLT